ncbi:MAG: putative quinol monooxygenase [Acidimicrobiales bacterium]
MDAVTMIIKAKSQPGKREELFALYRELLAPRAEQNTDQQVVVWSADHNDPDAFYLFELYRNMEAMGANAQASWFADYMAKAGPLMGGEPEVSMATPLWTKGV